MPVPHQNFPKIQESSKYKNSLIQRSLKMHDYQSITDEARCAKLKSDEILSYMKLHEVTWRYEVTWSIYVKLHEVSGSWISSKKK